MWYCGCFYIDGIKLEYKAEVGELGSEFGINGGRISKLYIIINEYFLPCFIDRTLVIYDQGWEYKAKTDLAKKALEYVVGLYDE